MGGLGVTHSPQKIYIHINGCQMGVRFVTAPSTRHMHYTMTCLNGDCVVLVTITVTTNSCTKETLGVRWVSDGC